MKALVAGVTDVGVDDCGCYGSGQGKSREGRAGEEVEREGETERRREKAGGWGATVVEGGSSASGGDGRLWWLAPAWLNEKRETEGKGGARARADAVQAMAEQEVKRSADDDLAASGRWLLGGG